MIAASGTVASSFEGHGRPTNGITRQRMDGPWNAEKVAVVLHYHQPIAALESRRQV